MVLLILASEKLQSWSKIILVCDFEVNFVINVVCSEKKIC